MKHREPPAPPSTDPADLFRVLPHVDREIDARLRARYETGYRDKRRPQPDLTATERVQVKAGLIAAKYPYLDRPRYTVALAREVAAVTQIVAAPDIDRPAADTLDALREPEGRALWRSWYDPLARTDKLPAVAAAKTLAILMIVYGTVYVRNAFNLLRESVSTQEQFNDLEQEVTWDAS